MTLPILSPDSAAVSQGERGQLQVSVQLVILLRLALVLCGAVLTGCAARHSGGHPDTHGPHPVDSTGAPSTQDRYRASDGSHFPFRTWLPLSKSEPSIVIVALHGISGASRDFTVLGKHLQESMETY